MKNFDFVRVDISANYEHSWHECFISAFIVLYDLIYVCICTDKFKYNGKYKLRTWANQLLINYNNIMAAQLLSKVYTFDLLQISKWS